MGLSLAIVDAFTDRPFAGNPAAVCLLPEPASAGWMQAVAAELNLSETAFLQRHGASYSLRWFTPAVEVELCGHATLASAHWLWESGAEHSKELRFATASGPLGARRDGGWIALDFPATPPVPAEVPPGLCEALGVRARAAGRTRFDWLVEVEDGAEVRAARPDFARLRVLPVRGVILTAASPGEDHDFVSRFFAPGAGVDEDPVTGSAHCALGPYWAARLGRNDVAGYQASRRGGTVRVRCLGDRVELRGRAVTVVRAELAPGAGPPSA